MKKSFFLALVALLILAVGIASYSAGEKDDKSAWTDPATGLMWQISPTGGGMNWAHAKTHCEQLNLGGHADWRLPTIAELRSLIRGCPPTESGGACETTDSCTTLDCGKDACRGCPDHERPTGVCWPGELGGATWFYWSASPVADTAIYAWGVHFRVGSVLGDFTALDRLVRCVR
jgi:hypothetical protein